MRRLTALLAVAAVVLAGCGGGDGDDAPAAPTGPNAAYLTKLGALCTNALDRRSLLSKPAVKDDTTGLAAYFRSILGIERDFRTEALKLDPPAELADEQRQALRIEKSLSDTIAGYERAARGNKRRFLEIVRRLEEAANPQIKRLNAVFERMELDACAAPELRDLTGS